MKSERNKTIRSMLMVAASASLLAACAMEEGKVAPDEASTTEESSSATGDEFVMRAVSPASSTDVNAVPAASGCRRVTASSIPVYTTATGFTVKCTFFAGDVFQYVLVGSPPLRYLTWCPRHTPPSQGEFSWAQGAGTVAAGC